MPVLERTIVLYKLYYSYAQLFPKKDKYTIGARCEQIIITIVELLIEASLASREIKRSILIGANTKLETLKILVRVLKELDILDQKKYLALQTLLQEIGPMVGGWIKSLPQQEKRPAS